MSASHRGSSRRAKQLAAIYEEAYRLLYSHPLLGSMASQVGVAFIRCPDHAGGPLPDPVRLVWEAGHEMLHLGMGHDRDPDKSAQWHVACDVVVARFLDALRVPGRPWRVDLTQYPDREEALYAAFGAHGVPDELSAAGLGGGWLPAEESPTPVWSHAYRRHLDWPAIFGTAVVAAVEAVVEHAAGRTASPTSHTRIQTPAARALAWCRTNYPLLGALAVSFTLIEDAGLCAREQIGTAAVCPAAREVYVNPGRPLSDDEARFVMCHELLHMGLSHHTRCRGRDPFLWNVACDYVINGWLLAMRVGEPPADALLEPAFDGLSAEEVYDRIVCDLRRCRRLATLRGVGLGDMLLRRPEDWWRTPAGVDLDSLYRRALMHGLACHAGRGLLPGRLIEEINALAQPPVPWDVELARWFDERFPPREMRRSYARPSRRQAATPDIPRPRFVPIELGEARCFGVVLDSSGSMDRVLLGRALGAIAAYATAHDVPAARLVMCDARPHDAGWLAPDQLAGRVEIRGRGGTVLQPGIDLIEQAGDFPPDGPLLIITDGQCDKLTVRREHAYLMPGGAALPHVPRGPVFRMAD